MTNGGLSRLLLKAGAFFIIWVFVSGQLKPYYLILGLCCSLAVAWVDLHRSPGPRRLFPWVRFFGYFPWLAGRVVLSSLHLTRLILHPQLPINPNLIRYPTRLRDHAALTLLGNSITLTPGTVTAEISRNELVVHAIDDYSAADLTSKTLEERVGHVFEQRERNRP